MAKSVSVAVGDRETIASGRVAISAPATVTGKPDSGATSGGGVVVVESAVVGGLVAGTAMVVGATVVVVATPVVVVVPRVVLARVVAVSCPPHAAASSRIATRSRVRRIEKHPP